jgi:hypothetical protein
MNEEKMFNIMNKLFSMAELNDLARKLVVVEDNIYTFFEEYQMQKVENKYIVTKFYTDLSKSFYNIKNAVVWITLYKRSKLSDALRVETLDKILEGTAFNMDLYQSLSKKSKDVDTQLMYRVKLEECKVKKKVINDELHVYIKSAKIWQEKLFKEAIK